MTTLTLGNSYTFDTAAPAILGTQIKNAKLLSILDYETARTFDNIDIKFRTIFPLLPAGTPDAIELTTYFLFKTESGEKIVIADIWINKSTITEIGFIQFQVMFTKASLADIDKVRANLIALGYTDFTIKQV